MIFTSTTAKISAISSSEGIYSYSRVTNIILLIDSSIEQVQVPGCYVNCSSMSDTINLCKWCWVSKRYGIMRADMARLVREVTSMPASEERLTALEKTVTSLRNDFLQAIVENTRSMTTLNKVILQQEQNARDANHEITILTGVVASQGRDIKDIKTRMDGFDLHFASQGRDIKDIKTRMDGFDLHFASLEDKFASLDGKFVSLDGRFTSLEDKFTSLDGKLEQVLQILTTPPKPDYLSKSQYSNPSSQQ